MDAGALQQNASIALERFRAWSNRGPEFGYDRDSLSWVEDFLESHHKRHVLSSKEMNILITLAASYLGECIIQTYGGSWKEMDGTWGVFFDDKSAAFPFAKVRKQVENGLSAGDSILCLFDMVPVILKKEKL